MNNFLLSKNSPAAVWKTALRILGIAMLSFLFIPEGWGQGNPPLDVRNLMADNVFLTYKARTDGTAGYAWYYKVGENGDEKEFSGWLTTGAETVGSPFSSEFYFSINNDVNVTPTPELTLNNFHYSGRNGVFLLNGAQLVKITAENACTLENTGTTEVLNEEKQSVIYIRRGSMLELNGGTEGMTIQNTQAQGNIQGLYNNYDATTILSGKIDFFAKNGNNGNEVYAIKNNGTLRATAGAEIRAMGKSIHPTGSHTSPFMCWDFSIPPPINSVISIKKVTGGQEGDEVASFEGDGESTNFLIPGEANTSYTVYVQGEKQMGRKQDLNNLGNLGSYTYTFDATTDGSETNEKQLSIYRSVIAPSQLTLKLSSVTDKLTLHYKEKDDSNYAWFYKIGDSDPGTEFSGTLEGTKEGWTHGAITISGNKAVTSADGSDYPILKLDGVTLASDDPLIEMTAGSQPVRLQAISKSTLKGGSNVMNITDNSIVLDGSEKGLEIIGTGQASHGIHLKGGNSKAIFAGQVTVDAAVPAYLENRAQLSANTDAAVLLSSSLSEAISLGGAPPSEFLGTPFLEWRFDNAPAAGGNLQVKNGNGNTLISTFPTGDNNKTFATNVTAGTNYTLWMNDTKQQKGKLSGGSTSEYTGDFYVPDGSNYQVYTDIALYRQIASSPEGLKDIIDNTPTNQDNPTKILLIEDIDLTSANFQLETNGKYIEIDGGGYKIIPHYGYENFNFPEGGGNSSLTLTNITLDCTNTSSRSTYAFINVKDPNTTITLGDGFLMENGERGHEDEIIKVYGIDMQAGTLIMKEGAVIEGNTDKKGAAIGITSDATLRLEGGKIQNCNGSTGLYLLRKEGATENPKVTIENDLPAGSVFEGVYLADYIDADGKITKKEVITAGGSHTIKDADLNKFTLMTVRQVGGTILSEYELYLDTDNAIKLRKFPLIITAPTFDDVIEGYSQPAAKPITIENTTGSEITITSVTLGNSNTDFTITEPTSDDERKVPVDSPNTHYTIQPVAGLSPGTYTATIEVTADGYGTYTTNVSFTVNPKPTPDPGPSPDPGPAPAPTYYQVVLPEVEGATTDPVPGNYMKEAWDSFRFYLTLNEGYRERSKPVVTTDRNETIEPRQSDGAYLIKHIRQDVVISISGIVPDTPTANVEVKNATLIRVVDGTLYITVPQPTDLCITDLAGRLQHTRRLFAGETRIEGLSDGMYILKLEGQKARKVIIR